VHSLMIEGMAAADLSTSLIRLTGEPERAASLHGILGEYCHSCRNILNSIRLCLYLLQKGAKSPSESWAALEGDYKALERLVDRLQLIYKPMVLTTVRMPLALLIEGRRLDWTERMAARGRHLEIIPPDESAVGDYDPVRLEQGLDAFVDWRTGAGPVGQSARLRWWAGEGQFHIDWEETDTGWRASTELNEEQFETLALPFLARVIAAHGGSLDLSVRQGFHVSMRWPLDVPTS